MLNCGQVLSISEPKKILPWHECSPIAADHRFSWPDFPRQSDKILFFAYHQWAVVAKIIRCRFDTGNVPGGPEKKGNKTLSAQAGWSVVRQSVARQSVVRHLISSPTLIMNRG